MNKVIKRFAFIENISICMLVIDFLIALLLFKFSSLSVKINCVIFGSLLIVHGLFALIKYFYDGIGSRIFSSQLINSVVGIILGLFLCFYDLQTIKTMGIIVGIWFIVDGIMKVYHSFIFLKHKEEIAPLVFMPALLIVIMGVLVIFNPFSMYVSVIRLLSIFMFGYVVLEGMNSMLYKKRAKNILALFK